MRREATCGKLSSVPHAERHTLAHPNEHILKNWSRASEALRCAGVLLWEMCNGMRAWEGLSQAQARPRAVPQGSGYSNPNPCAAATGSPHSMLPQTLP